MRDLVVSLFLLGLLPVCFRRPYIGIVVFSWLAYMRVQDLTWNFARHMRWSFYVAIVTFTGWFFSKRRGPFFLGDVRCYLMVVLAVLIGLGVLLAKNRPAWLLPGQISAYVEFAKIITIALFTTGIVTTRERLRLLIWVIALSFGFYGFKNALWGIKTLGQQPILRGPGGMLNDNNDFSLALAMAVPMLWNIGLSDKRRVLRRAFLWMVPMTCFTVLLTHSRGGFLALSAGIAVLVWHSRNRWLGISLAVLAIPVALIVMPANMYERFSSIADYKTDGSANARFKSWAVAIRMAQDNPLLGVGLANFRTNYLRYEPNPTPEQLEGKNIFVAHNSYLQIWAECGTPALMIYLSLIFFSFQTCWSVRRLAKQRYRTSWIINYATMFEASMATFMVGAVFLNRAHFDLFYHWVAIVLLFGVMAKRDLADTSRYPVRDESVAAPLRAVQPAGFGVRVRKRGFRDASSPVGA